MITRLVKRAPPRLHACFAAHSLGKRPFATTPAEQEEPSMTPAESAIAELLRAKLQPTELLVRDVSGGCGSMYAIDIASPVFRGATMLKQQRMVNAALGDVMREWHGVQLNTRVSEQ
ncbi:BolA protein [Metarhizium rileyi]|uniref:BolA protein n=1 Tax=Metarhizium rileyi (strain RCEF 4871) TaxID=1649241 RepID=A0A167JHV0_METRR|nr:BolA protein [Metarhizium rileyi RCEF 4871]TWU73145.1 hypothetical protein ED733_002243 [Metarhizium rileyi]